jgi:hypothetical protein
VAFDIANAEPETITHGDYRRFALGTTLTALYYMPSLHNEALNNLSEKRAGIITANEAKKFNMIETRIMIAFHKLRFGCNPIDCMQCKDEEAAQHDLNCDYNGNPADFGEGGFLARCDDKGMELNE